MPQHDSGRDRRVAGAQGDDFALPGLGQRLGGTADEGSVALDLDQRGAALSFPAARFEREKRFGRCGDVCRRLRDLEADRAVFGQPMALAAQLFQLLAAERVA